MKGKELEDKKNKKSSSSFKSSNDSFLSSIKKSEKLKYHADKIVKSGTEYWDFKAKVEKSLSNFKKHMINLNYRIEVNNYIEKYGKEPTSAFKKKIYNDISNDFNHQFSINSSSILRPFKRDK